MAAGILLRTYKLDARRIYEKNKGFQDFRISSIKSGTLCVRFTPFIIPLWRRWDVRFKLSM